MFTGCNSQICAQNRCEYDVLVAAMTTPPVVDELHRSAEQLTRKKHGTCEQQTP